jgi:hypothetical protein
MGYVSPKPFSAPIGRPEPLAGGPAPACAPAKLRRDNRVREPRNGLGPLIQRKAVPRRRSRAAHETTAKG